MTDHQISNDWKCTSVMALIIPGASFIASFVLTVIAICGMKRAKNKASLSSNSNTDSSNVNSSGVMS